MTDYVRSVPPAVPGFVEAASLPPLPDGWVACPDGFELKKERHDQVAVRAGFDFAPGVPTTAFDAHFGSIYIPDVVLAHRLAALGWTVAALKAAP